MSWHYTTNALAKILGVKAPSSNVSFSNVSTDTRSLQPRDLFFALRGENFDGSDFVGNAFEKGAVAAVTSRPDSQGPCLVVDNPLNSLQCLSEHHRKQYDPHVLAITGSCGKTSAKDFTHAVLQGNSGQDRDATIVKTQGSLNNEIGCPLSLLQLQEDTQMAIIEIGANHVGEIEFLCGLAKPTEAAITMIAPAHLEGFGSIDGVIEAKAEIIHALSPDGRFYVNLDDPECVKIAERFAGEKIGFGRADGADVHLEHCAFDKAGDLVLDVAPIGRLTLPLPIPAQVTNVLLAIAVGLQHGIEAFEEPLRRACRESTRFRIEQIGPLTILDDTYNASPASVIAALEALQLRGKAGQRIAVLGEMLELGKDTARFHREAGEQAGLHGISHLFAIGPHADNTVEGALAAGVTNAEVLETQKSIADAIFACATPGCCVLVKGSRGTRMEGVVESLRRLYQPKLCGRRR